MQINRISNHSLRMSLRMSLRARLAAMMNLAALALAMPAPASAGVNVWTGNGPTGGIVNVLAIDPNFATTLYAGMSGGGVFKSTDSGANWAAATTNPTNPLVQAVAIDHSSTPALNIYAGTAGGGVFKSTDSGGTWAAASTGLTNHVVRALAIDPKEVLIKPSNCDKILGHSRGG